MAQQQSNTSTSTSTSGGSNNTARAPASYPSPTSSQHYPSPSVSGYAYPPPTPGQGSEPSYRASPTGSNVSLPSLTLPPIRTVDGRQQSQQPSQQQGGPPTSAPPPLPPPINAQYYPGHSLPPPQHMNVTSDPNQHLRYPLPPPPDGRIMSGGRHKKEIKRRTKTGCLTCRKRRIKCDEAHPSCRNCLKSKRECLGYDPIFKAQPGPTAIQPAPTASLSMQATPSTAAPYAPPPQGYVTAGSQPYPPASAPTGSPRSPTEPYNDYGAAIDPALEAAADPSARSGTYNGTPSFRRGLDDASDNHRAKRTKFDELVTLRGVDPPSTANIPKPIPPATYEEIKSVYSNAYGPALDKFFESRWFQLRGLNHLLADTPLCEKFAALIQRFAIDSTHPQYFAATAATHSLEASVIWGMMALSRHVADTPNPTNGQVNYLETNDGVHDAANRFEIFENLILGQYVDSKPESEPKSEQTTARNGTVFDEQLKSRERDFWRLIHTFLSIHSEDPDSTKEIDDILSQCRQLLDSKENRDVLYSIVIARHLGARVPEFPSQLQQPPSNEESDEKAKLAVAKTFIEAQAGGKGTNQVIQRVCGMAVRSWSMPR